MRTTEERLHDLVSEVSTVIGKELDDIEIKTRLTQKQAQDFLYELNFIVEDIEKDYRG